MRSWQQILFWCMISIFSRIWCSTSLIPVHPILRMLVHDTIHKMEYWKYNSSNDGVIHTLMLLQKLYSLFYQSADMLAACFFCRFWQKMLNDTLILLCYNIYWIMNCIYMYSYAKNNNTENEKPQHWKCLTAIYIVLRSTRLIENK